MNLEEVCMESRVFLEVLDPSKMGTMVGNVTVDQFPPRRHRFSVV